MKLEAETPKKESARNTIKEIDEQATDDQKS